MDYEGRICRSPFERGAFMLPIMVGCSYNKCKFCGLFKHLKFRELPYSQVKDEITRVKKNNANPKKVFLGDGNAFSLRTDHLIDICNLIKNNFSNCKEINMDATISSILRKSDSDLKLLYEAGVRQLYLGIECGLDDVLEFMNKDHTIQQAYEAIDRLNSAGIEYDAHIMSGICGEGRGQENAIALAKFINETQPNKICNFDFGMHKTSEVYQDYENGIYKLSLPPERFLEQATLIDLINPKIEILYDAIFEYPPLRFKGTLPQNKEKLVSRYKKEAENMVSVEIEKMFWD